MTAPIVNGHRIVDDDLERLLVCAVVAAPQLLAEVPDVGVIDLHDPVAGQAFTAIRNLEAGGKAITADAVVAELERMHGVETCGARAVRAMLRSADADPICAESMRKLGDQVLLTAARREQAIRDEEMRAREDAEIDDIALRDCEPSRTENEAKLASYGLTIVEGQDTTAQPTEPPDPFEAALKTALDDVRKTLGATKTKRAPLFSTDAAHLLAEAFVQTLMLITGLLPASGTAIIGAEPKTTKTWMALEIAVAVATGTKAFGEFYAVAGRAAYFFAEDQKRQVRNRVRALLAGAGRTLQPGKLFLQPRGEFLDVTRDEDLAWIVASVRTIGKIDLLVIDPLRDVHSGEEDKSDSMRDVMRRLRLLGELLGCTVLVVHHTAKASKDTATRRPGQRLRGSGAIHGAIDAGLYLNDLEGNSATVFKNGVAVEIKGSKGAGIFTLELAIEDDADGEAVSAAWTVNRGPKRNAKEEKEAADDKAVFEWVRQLAMRGEHYSKTKLREHEDPPINSEIRLRHALDRLLDSGSLVKRGGSVRLSEPKQGDRS